MKMKEYIYEGKKGYCVFITQKERDSREIMEQIDYYRRIGSVAVFVSGNQSIEQILKEII